MRGFIIIGIGGVLGIIISMITFTMAKNNNWRSYQLFASMTISSSLITYVNYRVCGFNNMFISIEFVLIMLLVLSIIDIQTKIIPYSMIGTAYVVGAFMMLCNPNITLLDAAVGVLAVGGPLILCSLLTKGGVGMGDAYIVGFVGLTLGWQTALSVILYALVISGLVGIILIIIKKASRKTELPFIPFILIALLLNIVIF